MRNTFKFLCDFDNRSVTLICLKLSVTSNSCIEPLLEMFRNMQGIILYRNLAPSLASMFTKIFEDLSHVIAMKAFDSSIFRIHPSLRNGVSETVGVGFNENITILAIFVSRWTRSMCIARDLIHSRPKRFITIKYEVMTENIKEHIQTVLRFVDNFWTQAMTALKKDSQRGMILSQSVKKRTKQLTSSEIDLNTFSALLHRQGFGKFWDDYTLCKPP